MLAEIRSEPDSLAGLVSPLLRANVLDRLGRSERAGKERQRFTAAVDHLRGRLEAELGQDLLDKLLKWIEAWRHQLPSRIREELQRTVFLRVTRPLAVYYRGVSQLWLGEYARSEASFQIYLKMLPESDARSKAHELLGRARRHRAAL